MKTVASNVLTAILVIAIIIAGSIISYNDTLRKLEVKILRLENAVAIETEEIANIQQQLKELIDEYVDHEKETNQLVVENLNPSVVLNMYPELKSSNMYNNLSRQYLKSMRNIKDAKREYNQTVEKYNNLVVTFKGRILSKGAPLLEYMQ